MTLTPDVLRRLALVLGWTALAAILFSTLSPLGLRPHVPGVGANAERFAAFFLMTATFAIAYPRQRWLLLAAIILLALGLEWLQTLEASRHGRTLDAVVKICGALAGAGAAAIAARLVPLPPEAGPTERENSGKSGS